MCNGPTTVTKGAQDVIVHGGNVHVVLTFDDGVKWLARIKQSLDTSPPLHVQKIDKLSEVATFRVLHEAGILVPQVWNPPHHDSQSDLSAGIAVIKLISGGDLNYFFVEFATGQAYKGFHGWQSITRAPTDHELVIIESYAKFQMSLEKLTFHSIGSPTFDANGKVIIGPVVSDIAPLAEPPFYLGPFASLRDRYIAYFDTVMTAILEDRWCAPDRSLPTYQAMLEAKRLVEGCKELAEEGGPFYMKHGEAKCDHFLLNDDGEITATLDWEW